MQKNKFNRCTLGIRSQGKFSKLNKGAVSGTGSELTQSKSKRLVKTKVVQKNLSMKYRKAPCSSGETPPGNFSQGRNT
jgi:hypothetical protein